jgi:cysteine desulfurase/selenocysteine lyase
MNIKKDFPIFKRTINGKPLIYFDNASTTQKPQVVLDAIINFYTHHNANVHRGVYTLAEEATQAYEHAREVVAQWINAHPSEIIFTRGTTEGINMIASTFGPCVVQESDTILITELEHHANLVPWQLLAYNTEAFLKYIPVAQDGTLKITALPRLLTKKTKIVALSHVSNALGVHNPIQEIIEAAHAVGAYVLIDAAQSIAHQPIDVQKMDCDFLAFSGHKIFGPTGIGVLYVKKEILDVLPPYQVGGGMVHEVDYKETSWRPAPHKFEAGTPAIAQAVGLAAAITYMQNNVDWAALRAHEAALCSRLIDGLSAIKEVTLLGPIEQLKKVGHMVTFTVDGVHAHDVSAYLDQHGICVRAGHHCAQPLAKKMGIDASVRVSFHGYNSIDEVDTLIQLLKKMIASLRKP